MTIDSTDVKWAQFNTNMYVGRLPTGTVPTSSTQPIDYSVVANEHQSLPKRKDEVPLCE